MRAYLSLFLLLFMAMQIGKAQLVTNNSRSVNDLVRNVLTGNGVEISNVTYVGASRAIGEFFGASSNIGLDHGILLSTGVVLDVDDVSGRKNGPVGPNNNPGASTIHKTAGDNDVLALTSSAKSFDAAIIEFDFVPQGDTVRFRYVFASEEYPQYVGTINNDAFGFFISGPGFAGKKNTALLPDGVTAVSINNVNAGSNSAYFVNNGNGINGSSTTSNTVVNFNGFTRVLTAVAKVTPCQTYHLKIAISDIGDEAIDSGVFLEASSLYSVPTFELTQGVDYAPTGSNTLLYEGCSHGELTVSRSEKLGSSLVIPFKVYGSATAGADYVPFPNSISFAPGETTKTINVQSIRDGDIEADETIILRFRNPSICESDSVDMVYTIRDLPELKTTTTSYSPVCAGDEINISTNASGGVPAITYLWQSGETSATRSVSPLVNTNYVYEARDACGQTKIDSAVVTIPIYSPLTLSSLKDSVMRCRGAEITYTANPAGGAGFYSYLWNTGKTTKTIVDPVMATQMYTVTVTDKCGETATESATVTLNYPAFTATSSKDTSICYGSEASVVGAVSGGIGPYTYFWNGVAGQNYTVLGVQTKSHLFEAYDSCGIIPAEASTLVTVQKPSASFEINAPIREPNEKISMLNSSIGAVNYFWDFGNEEESTEKNPFTKYPEANSYTITMVAYDDLGCADTTANTLEILHPLYYYLPNAFTPNKDGKNDVFLGESIGVTSFNMYIYDRWGNLVFQTTDIEEGWDGNFTSGKEAPADVYVVKIRAKSAYRDDKEYDFTKTVTLVR